MGGIDELRRAIKAEVFDYQQLMSCLSSYAKPRDKVRSLMSAGDIIRVKKGLYVFGETYRRRPLPREILANLIYGPSYISLDYALAFYGIIPERVAAVTSVTVSRSHRFETPLGRFTYRRLSEPKYAVGIDQRATEDGQHFLIASPEKALADKVWTDRRFTPRKTGDFPGYLDDDLRIDQDTLLALDLPLLEDITRHYGSRKIRLLRDYLSQRFGGRS